MEQVLRAKIIDLIRDKITNGEGEKYFPQGLKNLHCFQGFELDLENKSLRQDFQYNYYNRFKRELNKILVNNDGKLRLPIKPCKLLEDQITPILFIKICSSMKSKDLKLFLSAFSSFNSSNSGTYIDIDDVSSELLPKFDEYYNNSKLVFYRIINALEILPIKRQVKFLSNWCMNLNPFGSYDILSELIIDIKTGGFGELNLFVTTLLYFYDIQELNNIIKFLTNHFDEETASFDDASDSM